MANPFSLSFGKCPINTVGRIAQTNEILDAFTSDPINQQMFAITGVRGAGKTVLMSEISNILRNKEDWIVVDLNSSADLLFTLLAKLYSNSVCASIIKAAKINLTFFGFGLEIDGTIPVTDAETAIIKILNHLKKHNKRLLITIDEVANTESMRYFAGSFQIFIRQNLPVFLLITGLYENIDSLQNEDNLTFLYRAPKIFLNPLNTQAMAEKYKSILNVSFEDAYTMATLTSGYPFAFQMLGFLTWENSGNYKEVLEEYEYNLNDCIYDKIWSELSEDDRSFLVEVVNSKNGDIQKVKKALETESAEFISQKKKLIRKGILIEEDKKYLLFALPLFGKYTMENFQ